MKKFFIFCFLIVLLGLSGQGLAQSIFPYATGTVSLSSDTSYLLSSDWSSYSKIAVYFKMTVPDTLRPDTITVKLQTSWDNATWTVVSELPTIADTTGRDTTQVYRIFTTDSLFLNRFKKYARFMLCFNDTAVITRDSLIPNADATPKEWHASIADSAAAHYKMLRKAYDSTSYIEVTSPDSAVLGDSIELMNFTNHTATHQLYIDSIRFVTQMRRYDSLAQARIGICIKDSTCCSWGDTFTVCKDSIKTYVRTLATNPRTLVAWLPIYADSLIGAWRMTSMSKLGHIRVFKTWAVVYYKNGAYLSPPMQYEVGLKLKQ